VELALMAGLILAAIWLAPLYPDRVIAKRVGTGLALAAFAVAVASTISHRDSLRDLGIRFDNFLRVLGWLALPTLIVVGGLLATGYGLNSLHFGRRWAFFRLGRFIWSLLQQYLLQGFLNRRLQDVCGPGSASVILAAAVFAGLHAPNPVLMLATFLAGCFWAKIFQRAPNLFALAVSHYLLAFVLGRTLPATVLANLRVGWSYWR
jgi:hypothetical protein